MGFFRTRTRRKAFLFGIISTIMFLFAWSHITKSSPTKNSTEYDHLMEELSEKTYEPRNTDANDRLKAKIMMEDQDDLDGESITDQTELAALQQISQLSDKELHNLQHGLGPLVQVNARGVHSHSEVSDFNSHREKSQSEFLVQPKDNSKRSEIPSSTLKSGESFINCRRGSCLIHNLYVINNEFHVFIPENTNTKSLPKSILIHISLGVNGANKTLRVHHHTCPEKYRSSMSVISHLTSIFSIPADSTLMGVTSTAVGAWFTMQELDVKYNIQAHRIILIDDEDQIQAAQHGWHEFFHFMAPKNPVTYLDKLGNNVLIRKAVVGINKKFKIHDFWVESLHGRGKEDTRANAFRTLADSMRKIVVGEDDTDATFLTDEEAATNSANSYKKLVCYVSRRGNTRRVINEEQLLKQLSNEGVDTMVFDFQQLSLDDQIRGIYLCDVLIGMHHTLLAHMFFMKRNSVIIEMFPYRYRKKTFENFAQLLGHRYLHWQNTVKENAVFDWDYIQKHKLTPIKQENILHKPIDWEQINNQLIEFKSACAIASILRRVLVLPLLGHRSAQTDKDWDFTFKITDFHWLPFENYFDSTQFDEFPCTVVSNENFRSLHAVDPNFSLATLHFNPVAKATSEQQMVDYYSFELGYPFDSISSEHGRMSQLSESDIVEYFGNDNSRVLGFGTTFWMYGFDREQPYPLTQYVDYMDHPLYNKIVRGLQVSGSIKRIVAVAVAYLQGYLETPIFVSGHGSTNTGESLTALLKTIKGKRESVLAKDFIAIHVRRGDYWNKCKRIKDLKLRAHCFPTVERIEQVLDEYIENRRHSLKNNQEFVPLIEENSDDEERFPKPQRKSAQHSLDLPDYKVTIYIATNLGGSRDEFAGLMKKYRVLFFEDLFILSEKESRLDSNHMALIDVELCSKASMFFGNFYSSFSRSIFEKRENSNFQYASF